MRLDFGKRFFVALCLLLLRLYWFLFFVKCYYMTQKYVLINIFHIFDTYTELCHHNIWFYWLFYMIFSVLVISTLLSSLTLYLGTLNAAKILHHMILFNVLRVPLTTFFDVTPLGRILNRFSKDIDTLDNILPMTLRGWVMCFYSVSLSLTFYSD